MSEPRVAPVVEELVPLPDPARCCELLTALPYRLFLDSAATVYFITTGIGYAMVSLNLGQIDRPMVEEMIESLLRALKG